MFVFGLTGGMGCGKSTVASMFAQHGLAVLDADAIGRNILDEDGYEANCVKARFPDCVSPSAAINRRAIAAKVFTDKRERHWLEDLMHPAIEKRVHHLLKQLKGSSRTLALLEGAVLLESRFDFSLSGMVVVTTPLRLRMQRIEARDGHSMDEIASRIKSQLSEWEKILHGDYLIENAGPLEYTKDQVDNVLQLMFREIGGVQ